MSALKHLGHFSAAFISLLSLMSLQARADLKAALPVVINTWYFKDANQNAYTKLMSGGSALDAVEEGCSTCERQQCDGTVGFGGSPDENGETTLDAMIMDGRTMNAGAVGALREVKSAVSVARRVLENTEHSLLVGSQATKFALEMGFAQEPLTTNTSQAKWETWKNGNCQPNFWTNVSPNPDTECGPYHPENNAIHSSPNYGQFCESNHDTIGMVAMDRAQNLAVATSSNGAIHKIPGRVGDSPIIGSGGYVENGVGGAAATGDGDVLMRFLPSFRAVEGLRRGLKPSEAAEAALQNIKNYFPKYMGGIVVLSASGEYAAACHGFPQFSFAVAHGDHPTKIVTMQC